MVLGMEVEFVYRLVLYHSATHQTKLFFIQEKHELDQFPKKFFHQMKSVLNPVNAFLR